MKTWSTFLGIVFCASLTRAESDTLVVFHSDGVTMIETLSEKSWDYSYRELPPLTYSLASHTEPYYIEHPGFSLQYSFEERDTLKTSFSWWSLSLSGEKYSGEIFNFDTKPKDSGYILRPLTWSSDGNLLYLFGHNGDSFGNERGIFEYSLSIKKTRLIVQPDSYVGIPLVSSDKTRIFFLRPSFDGGALISLDLSSGKEIQLWSGQAERLAMIFGQAKHGREFAMNCSFDPNQPDMRSPFLPEEEYCVTRIGGTTPWMCDEACDVQANLCSGIGWCEGHCVSPCMGCIDAVDMDVVNAVDGVAYPITATAGGYVIRVQTNCPLPGLGQGNGFGYHVVIRHGAFDDESAPETLYAHLISISVSEGEFVYMGQEIGILGNSQALDCNGDGVLDCDCESNENSHLHFEYYDGSGAFLYDESDIHSPIFQFPEGPCGIQSNNSYVAGPWGYVNWGTIPNAEFSVAVSLDCEEESFLVLIGETCECCESVWRIYEYSISPDTLILPIVPALYEDGILVIEREVYSSCIDSVHTASTTLFLVDNIAPCNPGCTDASACNFNPESLFDNGSCEYDCWDTCHSADINNDLAVNIYDIFLFFSLVGDQVIPLSEGDLDGNGMVNTSDFLMMIFYFGQFCE